LLGSPAEALLRIAAAAPAAWSRLERGVDPRAPVASDPASPGATDPRAPAADGAAAERERRATGALTDEDRARVIELAQRDVHVRAHEAAHQAAGGALAGGASFTYETGPDGRQYAVAGEVPIRIESGRTPDETIQNAQQARAAALAPSDPSPADLSIASAAAQLEAQARAQLARRASEAYGAAPRDGGDPAARHEGDAASRPDGVAVVA
jgi:hypothetical protein